MTPITSFIPQRRPLVPEAPASPEPSAEVLTLSPRPEFPTLLTHLAKADPSEFFDEKNIDFLIYFRKEKLKKEIPLEKFFKSIIFHVFKTDCFKDATYHNQKKIDLSFFDLYWIFIKEKIRKLGPNNTAIQTIEELKTLINKELSFLILLTDLEKKSKQPQTKAIIEQMEREGSINQKNIDGKLLILPSMKSTPLWWMVKNLTVPLIFLYGFLYKTFQITNLDDMRIITEFFLQGFCPELLDSMLQGSNYYFGIYQSLQAKILQHKDLLRTYRNHIENLNKDIEQSQRGSPREKEEVNPNDKEFLFRLAGAKKLEILKIKQLSSFIEQTFIAINQIQKELLKEAIAEKHIITILKTNEKNILTFIQEHQKEIKNISRQWARGIQKIEKEKELFLKAQKKQILSPEEPQEQKPPIEPIEEPLAALESPSQEEVQPPPSFKQLFIDPYFARKERYSLSKNLPSSVLEKYKQELYREKQLVIFNQKQAATADIFHTFLGEISATILSNLERLVGKQEYLSRCALLELAQKNRKLCSIKELESRQRQLLNQELKEEQKSLFATFALMVEERLQRVSIIQQKQKDLLDTLSQLCQQAIRLDLARVVSEEQQNREKIQQSEVDKLFKTFKKEYQQLIQKLGYIPSQQLLS